MKEALKIIKPITKVYTLYCNGTHIGCFKTESEAIDHASENYMHHRDVEIDCEDYEPDCDCKNEYLEDY
jgi:hypothetical protein